MASNENGGPIWTAARRSYVMMDRLLAGVWRASAATAGRAATYFGRARRLRCARAGRRQITHVLQVLDQHLLQERGDRPVVVRRRRRDRILDRRLDADRYCLRTFPGTFHGLVFSCRQQPEMAGFIKSTYESKVNFDDAW